MDDIMLRRPRYTRYSGLNKRRRKSLYSSNTLMDKIILQVLISITVLIITALSKNINTKATNYLTEKVKTITTANIEVKTFYEWFEKATGISGKGDVKTGYEDNPNLKDGTGDTAYFNETDISGYEKGVSTLNTTGEIGILSETSDEIKRIRDVYKFVLPAEGVLVTEFGTIKDPGTGESGFHRGVDIETAEGSPVRSALDGVISMSGSERIYGDYLVISHGDGIETVYGHCSKIFVKKGSEVKQGDIIAESGDVEIPGGSHLHFEIWKDGKAINPLYLVNIPLS